MSAGYLIRNTAGGVIGEERISKLITNTYLAVTSRKSIESNCLFAGMGDSHALIMPLV